MKQHIVLVGLPGAGKTTVGALVAATLGARFLDGDALVEARVGKPVTRIFAEDGEPAFRGHERDAVAGVLAEAPCVIAPGGGWAAQPGNLESAAAAFVIHLAVSAPEALQRLEGEGGRPLLRGDSSSVLRAMSAVRLPLYRRAHATVKTDGLLPEEVADRVVQLARSKGGW